MNRRTFLRSAIAAAGVGSGHRSGSGQPHIEMPCGVAAGDVTGDRAIIWSRADRPGRMHVEYATTESFRNNVHYCVAHYYDPAKARFTQFDPFWEFVAGPLNAGTAAPPTTLDATFGPEAKYRKGGRIFGRAPSEGLQFFGKLKVDARTRALTASLHDVANETLFSVDLAPEDV